MKASLLTRAATALLLAAGLAAATGTVGVAATTTETTGQTSGTGAPAAPSSNVTPAPNAAAPGQASSTAPQQSIEQIANQRLDDLHTRLQITPSEQPQWNKFAAVMRDNARQLDQAYQRRAEQFEAMNAVENMRSYQRIEQMRTRDTAKLVPAFQAVYASLSPEQKHAADDLFRAQAEQAQQHHQAEMQRNQTANGTSH